MMTPFSEIPEDLKDLNHLPHLIAEFTFPMPFPPSSIPN